MGRLYYCFEDPMPLSDFNKRLGSSQVHIESDYRWRLPIIRLWHDGIKLVGKTDIHGHVVLLKPLDAHTGQHLRLAVSIAEICGTKVRIEDLSHWGSSLRFAKALIEEGNKPDKSEQYGFRPDHPNADDSSAGPD